MQPDPREGTAPVSERGENLRGGRYELRAVLGSGAHGETLRAVDTTDGRAVAIKRFFVLGARGWKDFELAEREARVLQTLSYPCLPAYIDHFEEGGVLHLVMELVEGETLASLRASGKVTRDDVLAFLEDVFPLLDATFRRREAARLVGDTELEARLRDIGQKLGKALIDENFAIPVVALESLLGR